MANDPNWSSVVLAMHMYGQEGAAVFPDMKGHTMTVGSGVITSYDKGFFQGFSGGRVSCSHSDFNLPGDFTVEFWNDKYFASGTEIFVALGSSQATAAGFAIRRTGYETEVAVGDVVQISSWYQPSAFTHTAVVRASNVYKLFIDGVGIGTYTNSTAITGSQVYVGEIPSLHSPLNASMYDLRITKGVARYSADFSPPFRPFDGSDPALTGTVKDSANNNAIRTVRGYRRSDGAFSGSTISSAGGTFSVTALDASPHYAVCLSDTGLENGLIYDNVLPV